MRKRPTEGAKIITSPSITKNTVRTRRRAERLRRTGGRAIRFIIVTIAWAAALLPPKLRQAVHPRTRTCYDDRSARGLPSAQMMIRVAAAALPLAAAAPATLAADCPSPERKPQIEIVIDDGS